MCILDEMNLSHPEQYLAPILSAMERQGGEIPLHGGDAGAYGIPQAIPYPGNLVIIGTVNMDETTIGRLDDLSGEDVIVRGMAESAHLYQDALRWGARRPECTLLLVPTADATAWLTSPEYIAEHHVGVVALRPDLEPPEWFRGMLTELGSGRER